MHHCLGTKLPNSEGVPSCKLEAVDMVGNLLLGSLIFLVMPGIQNGSNISEQVL